MSDLFSALDHVIDEKDFVRLIAMDRDVRRDPLRVHLSAGTGPALDIDPKGPPPHPFSRVASDRGRYRAGALLPALPWRVPNGAEAAALWKDNGAPSPTDIAIVRVFEPDPFASTMDRMNPLRAIDPSDPKIWALPHMRWLLGEISRVCAVSGPLTFKGVSDNLPGCATTTFVRDLDVYLGLHLDDGEGCAIDLLADARNRISINIGDVDRYLLFVNVTVRGMAALVGSDADRAAFHPGLADDVGRAFMRAFPAYPAIKVRVAPGEAYIAPTENILHDASSSGTHSPGRQLIILGHFTPKRPS